MAFAEYSLAARDRRYLSLNSNKVGDAHPVISPLDETHLGRYHEFRARRALYYVGVAFLSLGLGVALARFRISMVIGALFGFLSMTCILLRPWWGLILYTVVFLTRPAELYPALAPLRLEKIIGSITVIGLFAAQYHREGRLRLDGSRQTKFLGLLLIAAIASAPLAYWRSAAIDGVMTMMKAGAFYLMVILLVETRKRLHIFIATFVVLTSYLAASSLYTYLTGGAITAQGIQRAVGLTSAGGNPNFLGTTVACVFPLLLLMSFHKPLRWLRVPAAAGAALMVITLSTTGSRASVLGFLAGLACLWWLSPRRMITGLAGLMLLILGLAILPEQYKERYATITHSKLDASSEGRIESWKAGMQMLGDRPLFGVGIENYMPAHAEYSKGKTHLDAHNMYVLTLAEMGLLGALAFFGLLIEMVRLNRRVAHVLESEPNWRFEWLVTNGIFAGFIVLLIAGFFGNSFTRRDWYVFGGIDLAILRCYLRSLPKPGTAAATAPRATSVSQQPSPVGASRPGNGLWHKI